MRYDVKKEINAVVTDTSLSKAEKIQRIKDIYNSGVTGADTKTSGDVGHGAFDSQSNGSNSKGQGQGQGNGQNQGGEQGGNRQGQGGQQGNGDSQDGQEGQGNGQNQGGEQGGNRPRYSKHNDLKNQAGNGSNVSNGSQNAQQGNGDSQDGQQGQGNGQNQQNKQQGHGEPFIPDEYTIGRILGRRFAEDLYKHNGLTPLLASTMELPTLDPMKILESVNESFDDDIARILDDNNLSTDEIVNRIHDIYLGIPNNQEITQNTDEPDAIYVPNDVIIMRNGTIDEDNPFNGTHVIDQNIGDEIRKELGITPKDPDWGLSDDEDSMIKEAFPIIDDVFSLNGRNIDKEIIEGGENMKKKIKGRIRKSREGIIDWKRALQDFVSERSHTYTKGALRKNIYQRTGIGLRHRRRVIKDYNKCVVYIDTSGSVNNSSTQLIPVMAGEIGKIMQDCHFATVDIHLFDDTVYNEHFDVDSYTVGDENWGIEGADEGCGTNIHSVYRHILKNYVIDGELNFDVNAIIIISDVSGMIDTGGIQPFTSRFNRHILERMLYVIYNNYSNAYLADVNKSIGELVSKYSQYYVISVESFKKQILSESMNNIKSKKLLSEAVSLASVKKKKEAIAANVDRTDDEKEERLRRAEIQGARAIGRLDHVLPELVANLERLFPNCRMAKEYQAVVASPNMYYVTEDVHVVLHMDIDKSNFDNLVEACGLMQIDQIIGNVSIDGRYISFKYFPTNFPKEIDGNFRIMGLSNLRDFSNAPSAVTGRVSINTTSKFIRPAILNAYRNSIVASPTQIDDGRNKPKSFFTMNKTDESFENIIMERIKLGESFMINEMAVAPSLEPFRKPTRARYQKKGEDSTEFDKRKDNWLKNTDIYRKNIDIWMDVIKPIISVGLGDIKENDVTVAKDAMNISKNDVKHIKQGFKIYTTKDNLISAVYCKLSDKSEDKLICLRKKDSDDFITNPDDLMNETKSRWNYFKECFDNIAGRCKILWTNLLEGPRSATDKKSTIEENLLNFLFCSLYLLNNQTAKKRVTGNETQKVLYQFAPENIINDGWLVNTDDVDYVDKTIGDILSYLFPGYHAHRIGDSTWQVGPIRKTDIVNLSKTLGNPRDGFIKKAIKSCDDNNLNPCELFTDDILRGFVVGGSVRNKDEYPIYDLDSVKEASFDELAEWTWEIKDVNIFDTALKRMTVKTITKDKFGDEIFNSGDVMMYFPDRCQKQYYIDVDVDAESVEYAAKKANRINSRAGMYGTIKNYEYDRKTGQRIRKDIVGLDQLNKVSKGNETFSNFNEIFDEIISNRDVYEDAEAALRNAVDVYNAKAKEWEKVNGLVSKFDRSVKLLMSTVEAIRSYVLSNPDEAKLKEKYIEQINSDFADIPELIENIATYEDFNAPENDDAAQKRRIELAKECIDSADAFTKLRGKFKTYFQEISGYNKQIVDAQQRRANKLSSHQTKIKPNSVNPAQSQTVNANVNEIKGIVDDLTNKVKGIMDVANGVDFVNGANRRARGQFQTRDNMVNSVNVELSDALVFGNEIVNNNYDITDDVVKKFKNVDVICNDIISQSSDNLADSVLIDNFVSLINSCYDVNDYKERYYPTEKQSDTTATTA